MQALVPGTAWPTPSWQGEYVPSLQPSEKVWREKQYDDLMEQARKMKRRVDVVSSRRPP